MASDVKAGDFFPHDPRRPAEFKLDKGNELLSIEPHRDGELFIGCDETFTYEDDGIPHGCHTGVWLTRDEAIQVRDFLSAWLGESS